MLEDVNVLMTKMAREGSSEDQKQTVRRLYWMRYVRKAYKLREWLRATRLSIIDLCTVCQLYVTCTRRPESSPAHLPGQSSSRFLLAVESMQVDRAQRQLASLQTSVLIVESDTYHTSTSGFKDDIGGQSDRQLSPVQRSLNATSSAQSPVPPSSEKSLLPTTHPIGVIAENEKAAFKGVTRLTMSVSN